MRSKETIEGGAMASYLTGSMRTFPDKLIKLEYLPKISELELHLGNLKECFFKVAGRGKINDQAQEWMKQVRELFFAIEDWIDENLGTPKQSNDQQLRTNMADPTELEEEIKETHMAGASKIEEDTKETKKVDQLEIEEKIKGFIILAEAACGRSTRYKLLDEHTTSGAVAPCVAPRVITIDSRLLLDERPYVTDLDHPVQELKKHLTDEHPKELKVVSIVGTGGLGKTTLAKKIHEELQGKFQCGAFVHIRSRHTSILTILVNMLQQITSMAESQSLLDEQKVIAQLRSHLRDERYFIVLDGIWSIQTWRAISCALPGNSHGSRILITTRINDVAKSCSPRYTDVVHQMEPLSNDDSKRLFDQKTNTRVDDDILKMCGGIPLAITIAAGLSIENCRELQEPNMLGQPLLSSLEQYYSLSPEMTKILHMSYADLSIPLRSCLLYLGVFPEDYTIKKDHLIRRWVAEGFIPRIDNESSWVTGERYFNELISRRLVQPVYDYKHDDDQAAVGCTVHPVLLDFIRTLSREENFATTAAELSYRQFPCETIRRFSLDCSNEDEAAIFESSTEQLLSIRTLTVSGDVQEMLWAGTDSPSPPGSPPYPRLPPWAKNKDVDVSSPLTFSREIYFLLPFKLLRVLDLGDAKNLNAGKLEGIGGLVLLRYLRLAVVVRTQLGNEIGELEQLETLDLRGASEISFYEFKFKLRKLVHVLYDVKAWAYLRAEDLLGLPELEEVSNIEGRIKSSSAEDLRKLLSGSKRLRILGISLFRESTEPHLVSFLEELGKSKLDSLTIYCRFCDDDSIGLLMESWRKATTSADANFEPGRFELRIESELGKFPTHMGSLGGLTHLHIAMTKLEGLRILGNMPRLILLKVSSYKPSSAGRFSVKEGAFQRLSVLSLTCRLGGMGMQFEQGAMPQLQRLVLSFTVSRSRDSLGNFNFGMENLTCLRRIRATINCDLAKVREIEQAEKEAKEIVSEHINKPILELFRDKEGKMST